MDFLLDTNMVVFWFDRTKTDQYLKVHKKIKGLNRQDRLCISILTLYELEYSIFNAHPEQKSGIQWMEEETKNIFEVLPLTYFGAKIYGELKSRLKGFHNISRENIKKHNIDIMLASTAIAQQCVLVSGDNIFNVLTELNRQFKFQNWLL